MAEEGKKKSIFKRWWFWLIVIIVVIAIAGGGSGGSGSSSGTSSQSAPAATEQSASDSASTSSAADTSNSSSDSTSSSASGASTGKAVDNSNLAVGDSATLSNGLVVSVDDVKTGLQNYDGSDVTAVTVTYTNNGTKNASFNVYDWKAEDNNGAQRNETYYSKATDELNSGELSAGGTVTGTVYFDSPIAKVHYYSNMFSDSSAAAWAVS